MGIGFQCRPPVGCTMGFFARRISDTEWLDEISHLYQAALPATTALSRAVDSRSTADKFGAVQSALQQLPVIAGRIEAVPSPTSTEACQAKKSLELALKCYARGARQGAGLFQNAGALGECLDLAGWAERMSHETEFELFVTRGDKNMAKAGVFFSIRR